MCVCVCACGQANNCIDASALPTDSILHQCMHPTTIRRRRHLCPRIKKSWSFIKLLFPLSTLIWTRTLILSAAVAVAWTNQLSFSWSMPIWMQLRPAPWVSSCKKNCCPPLPKNNNSNNQLLHVGLVVFDQMVHLDKGTSGMSIKTLATLGYQLSLFGTQSGCDQWFVQFIWAMVRPSRMVLRRVRQ